MSEDNGKIYANINRIPKVSFEAAAEILPILQEASKEFPEISRYYVESSFKGDRAVGGGFRYEQYIQDIQKWRKKWLGTTKR